MILKNRKDKYSRTAFSRKIAKIELAFYMVNLKKMNIIYFSSLIIKIWHKPRLLGHMKEYFLSEKSNFTNIAAIAVQ